MLSPIVFLVVLSLIAFFFFRLWNNHRYETSSNIETNQQKRIAYFELNDWASDVPPDAYVAVFKDDAQTEMQVLFGDRENTYFAGVLSDQLGLAGVKTIFVDLGQERCILGWVSSSIEAPVLFRVERDELNSDAEWWDSKKESTVEKGITEADGGWFIVPIKDDVQLWDMIIFSAIETSSSLERGSQNIGSWYEVEMSYFPPLDVSGWYVQVPIQ